MTYSDFPILEPTVINNNKDNTPGNFFVDEEGQASVILEDGTESLLLDSVYRDFMDMLNQNRIHLPSILTNLPENNSILHISGDTGLSDVHSVHDIIVEVSAITGEKIYKKLSRFTLGSDVTAKINKTGETKPIEEVIQHLMVVDLALDEYIDVNSSNKKLMVSAEGMAISSVILRLNKMDNSMSETNEENYAHVILTGKAGLEILKGVDILLNAMGVLVSIHVDHIATLLDGTEFTYSYDLSANNSDRSLCISFDEKNSDIYSTVSDGTIYIKHRKFTQYDIDISTPVENKINHVKNIIMTNNGHVSQINISNYEGSSLDINRIYYTKKQMTAVYLDVDEDNVALGGFQIPGDLTAAKSVTVEGTFNMSSDSKKIVLNTENTKVKDPIITVGTDNDGTAETVGMTMRTFFANNAWTKNMMDRATFSASGATVTDSSSSTVLGKRFTMTKDLLSSYAPEYYVNDSSLSDYYVADLYFTLDLQDVNLILANTAQDIINDINKSFYLRFAHTFTRFSGIVEANYTFLAALEFRRTNSVNYETWQDFRNVRTIGSTGEYIVNNTYDIAEIRFRVKVQVLKEVVDAVSSSKSIYFDISPLNMFVSDVVGTSIEKAAMNAYATKYISDEIDNKYPDITILSGNETDLISAYDSATGFYSYGTFLLNKTHTYTNMEDKSRPAITASFEPGFLTFSNVLESKHKRFNFRTQFYLTYPTATTDDEKTTRKNYGIEPTLNNYSCILKPYVSTYSEMVQSLGVSFVSKDSFGRTVDESTSTVFRKFDKTLAHALTPVEIPMTVTGSYVTMHEDALFDLGNYINYYNESIDQGRGVMGPNKLYFFFEIVLVRNTPDNSLYNNYDDGLYMNNTVFEIYDLRKEYRSIINNSIIDPNFYNDPTVRYSTSNWDNLINTISHAQVYKGPGVSSAKNYLDGLKLTLEKSTGTPYSTVKLTNNNTNVDRRIFQADVVSSKVVNNLMKVYAKLGSIDSTFNFPSNEKIKVWLAASYISVDADGFESVVPISKKDFSGLITESYTSSESSTSLGLTDSTKTLDIGSNQTFAANMVNLDSEFYTELLFGSPLQTIYYDLNNITDNVDIHIHVVLSVPYNIKESVYDTLTFVMDTLDVRMATDVDYKNFDPEDGYLASYAFLYRKSSDALEFTETKYDTSNKELYVATLADLLSEKFEGNVKTFTSLEKNLTITLQGTLSGGFDISGTNEYYKKVKLSSVKTTLDQTGIVGVIDYFNPNRATIPYDTTYSARSIKEIINKARTLIRPVSAYEYTGSSMSYGTDTVATVKAVHDLDKKMEAILAVVEARFIATYNAMLATHTKTINLLTKADQHMNDYFRQDRVVNIGSSSANQWVNQVVSTAKLGQRIGGTILSIGGKVQILQSVGAIAGSVLFGTIGVVYATVTTVVNAVGGFVNKIFGKSVFKSKGGKGGDPGVNFWLINMMRSGGNIVYSSNYPYDKESILSSRVVWSTAEDVGKPICRVEFPFKLQTSIFTEYRTLDSLASAYYTGIGEIVTILTLQSSSDEVNWVDLNSFNVLGPVTIVDIYPGLNSGWINTDKTLSYRIVKTDYFSRSNGNIVERSFGHTVSERIRANNDSLWRYAMAKVSYTEYFTPPWEEPAPTELVKVLTLPGFDLYNADPVSSHSKHSTNYFSKGTYFAGMSVPDASQLYNLDGAGPRWYRVCKAVQAMPDLIRSTKHAVYHWTTSRGGFLGFHSRTKHNYRDTYIIDSSETPFHSASYKLPAGCTKIWSYMAQEHDFMNPMSPNYVGEFKLKIVIKNETTGSIIYTTSVNILNRLFDLDNNGIELTLNENQRYSYTAYLYKTVVNYNFPGLILDTNIAHNRYDTTPIRFPDLQVNIKFTQIM